MDQLGFADAPSHAREHHVGCIHVPELPLQLLLRAHPDWALHPAAVVAEDKPQAELLWVNEQARAHGVLPGQRYATALSLCRQLRAGTIDAPAIAQGVAEITALLRRFSPFIEPSADEPGVFWVDASGLGLLYASLATWAQSVQRALSAEAWTAVVVVGQSRFFTYALAKAARRSVICLTDRTREETAARRVPLDRLSMPTRARDALIKLGVRTVGGFVDLPASGVLERFGREVHRVHRLASGALWTPLQPVAEHIPLRQHCNLDEGERDSTRLLFLIKRELDPLVMRLAGLVQALASITFTCTLERVGHNPITEPYAQTIKPAEPTLDARQLLDLVRLRLESHPLPAAVIELTVEVTGVAMSAEQLRLRAGGFDAEVRVERDLKAADRALARIRAELGSDAVTCAVLQDAHLPEARFVFQPLDHVRLPRALTHTKRLAIRRLWTTPVEGRLHDATTTRTGPFVIAGGWWARQVTRQYSFLHDAPQPGRLREAPDGPLLYAYYDAERGRFMVQGAL